MSALHWLSPDGEADAFPPVSQALRDPDGLLAAGGKLTPERVLAAYRRGIFPWYEEGQPVLWWSPNPRTVLRTDRFHVSRSLQRHLRRSQRTFRFDTAFDEVIDACAAPRSGQAGTWITADMRATYIALHRSGWAHSVEIYEKDRLVGGLYGLAIDRMFFGESMFSRASDASKMAMFALIAEMRTRAMPLLDCQVLSPHLVSLGAECLARDEFVAQLHRYCANPERQLGFSTEPQPVLKLLQSVTI